MSGTGTITPAVTISNGNWLAPGAGNGGTLTLSGVLTLDTGALVRVDNAGSSLAQVNNNYSDSLGTHTLVVGAARLAATPYRFDLYECREGVYRKVTLEEVDAALPVLFKPLGTPLPTPSYVASDADFVEAPPELPQHPPPAAAAGVEAANAVEPPPPAEPPGTMT